jgi:flagellar protein FlaG
MSFEIGPLPPIGNGYPARRITPAPAAAFSLDLAQRKTAPEHVRDRAELTLPASPPTEALDAIGAAAERAAELRAQNRELHFRKDEASGRVIVQVRDLAGNVIRTIPPSSALEIMAGASI